MQNPYLKAPENLRFFQERQNTSLPYAFEISGQGEGEHLMVVGSLHGREPAGTEAIVRFVRFFEERKLSLKRGKITFVLGHPKAYEQGVRLLDQNLNRSFNEQLAENIEGRRAGEFRRYFEENSVGTVLDLHSMQIGNWQMAAYLKGTANRLFASSVTPLNFHFVVDLNCTPGSLLEEAARFGARGLLIECGNNHDPFAWEVAFYHLVQAVEYFGLMEKKDLPETLQIPKEEEIHLYETLQPIKPRPGFQFALEVDTGTFVQKDQIYATFEGGEYYAPQDCFIVMPDKNPNPQDADAGFLCLREKYQGQLI